MKTKLYSFLCFFGDLCIKFGRFVHPECRRIDYLSKSAKELREKKKK